MIYLIIDTNIWIYLANGFNSTSCEHENNQHFKLLAELKRLKEEEKVCIIVNNIVFEEWERNKKNANLKIKELRKKIKKHNSEKNTDKCSKWKQLKKDKINRLKVEIAANIKHIDEVEYFIYNDCHRVDILDKTKIDIFDMSILKKAPFHNTKNNTADAAILFSAYEYLKTYKNNYQHQNGFIFVSNNFKEFADNKNNDEFHPDIKEALISIDIQYSRELPNALNISHGIIVEMEAYYEYIEWHESTMFFCEMPYCQSNSDFSPWGYLDSEITIKYDSDGEIDPSQTELFPEMPKVQRKESKEAGNCVVCESLHFICPICSDMTYVDSLEGDDFECVVCEVGFRIVHDDSDSGVCLIVKDKTI